jgi:tetratricopeptide (TPR) repeat protein
MEARNMKNWTTFISLTLLIVTIFFISPAFALLDNDVDKAKEFMTAGMYPQAIELLNKRIMDKPTDAEAHFQLGICYINTGSYSQADERFASAVRIKSDYGYQIGGEYKKVGLSTLDKGNDSTALTLFKQAIKYQPDLKTGITDQLFEKGKAQPDRYFSMVLNLDPSQKSKVADYYKSLSDKTTDEEGKIAYLKKAADIDSARYGEKYNADAQVLGRKYLDLAKKNAVIPGKEEEKKKYKKLAIEYLGKEVVETELPEVYVLSPDTNNIPKNVNGYHVFEIKKGERTPYEFSGVLGMRTNRKITWTNSHFEMHYVGGTVVKISAGEKMPAETNDNFYLLATEDVNVTIQVTRP